MDEEDSPTDQPQLKKKLIVFRNPRTNQILSQVQVPTFVPLGRDIVCDLSQIKNRLRMLYIDVVCRGYHPVKGYEKQARNVFSHSHSSHSKNKKEEIVPVTVVEAIGTIWRCLARQVGRPLKTYNISQLPHTMNNILKELKNECTLKGLDLLRAEDHESDYKLASTQLEFVQQKLVQQMERIVQKSKQQEQNMKKKRLKIAAVIGKNILNIQKQVFLNTVIGIRQHKTNPQMVQLILQQSYPNIPMTKQKAIQTLGMSHYQQKVKSYLHLTSTYDLSEQSPIICHRCLAPLNSMPQVSRCNNKSSKQQLSNTIMTNPYKYNGHILNENNWQSSKLYIHPYLIYYSRGGKFVCDRHFCNKCEADENPGGACTYCEGLCNCKRCTKMDIMTKIIAVYLDYGGKLQDISSKFAMAFPSRVISLSKSTEMYDEGKIQAKDYIEQFHRRKIFVSMREAGNFEKTLYFSGLIDEQQNNGGNGREVYRPRKLQIDESLDVTKQRKLREHCRQMKIDRLQNLAMGRSNSQSMEEINSSPNKKRGRPKSSGSMSMSMKSQEKQSRIEQQEREDKKSEAEKDNDKKIRIYEDSDDD